MDVIVAGEGVRCNEWYLRLIERRTIQARSLAAAADHCGSFFHILRCVSEQSSHMLSVSTPRKRVLEEDGLERISSINISCPRGADAESICTPPKKSRATAASPAHIERPSFFPLGPCCNIFLILVPSHS